jgi:hypothetical protein
MLERFELSDCLAGRTAKGFPQDIAGSNLLTSTGVPDGIADIALTTMF